MTIPKVIGLWSPGPGCGKTTVSEILIDHYPSFSRLPFAQPLKFMLRPLLISAGYSPHEADHLLYTSEGKSQILDRLPGNLTTRQLLQTLGTEWGRELNHPDLWISIWMSRAKCFTRCIADDVRFNSEALAIKAMGGQIWAITRFGYSDDTGHTSEAGIDPTFIDTILRNDGDLLDLEMQIITALNGEPLPA